MSVKRVVVTGAKGKLAQVVMPALSAEGFTVYAVTERITDFYSASRALRSVPQLESLKALVHLAGAYEPEAVTDRDYGFSYGSIAVHHRMMEANYFSAVAAFQAVQYELIKAPGGGKFVVISTDKVGNEGWRNRAYIASKRALEGFADSFYLSPFIDPRVIRTDTMDTDAKRLLVAQEIVAHLKR